MKKIELDIIALSDSKSHPENYALVLEEQKGFRRLVVIIGPFEAQAIAIALERMKPKRPLTHDLFKNTLETTGARITEVIISSYINGTFHSTLVGKKADNSPFKVDARTSDAIALAVRFDTPIYTTEQIMREAGIVLESPSKAFTNKRGSLSEYSLEELERLLENVLEKEDFESAAKIRNAIRQKKTVSRTSGF